MVKIKFVYDIASPNGYLCHKVIPDFEAKHSVKFDYFICLLGGIHKLSNNTPPMIAYAEIPNKNSYFGKEIERFVEFHKIEGFQMNPHFPVNTLTMQRGALVAEEKGILMDYVDVMAKGMWEEQINLGDKDILIDYLNKNGLDGSDIIQKTSDDAIKQKLIKNTEEAVAMGVFGVPTFFIGKQIFWGKEALREMPDFL